jgi:hypothetical protein
VARPSALLVMIDPNPDFGVGGGRNANITFITSLMYICSNISISIELICHNILCLSPTHWRGRPMQHPTVNA